MINRFLISAALMLFIVNAISISASDDQVPPGGYMSGYLSLGEGDCFIPPGHIELDDTHLKDHLSLGDLPTVDPVGGGWMNVTAGSDWTVTCIEMSDNPDGRMLFADFILHIPLQVNSASRETILSSSAEVIETGNATLCQDDAIAPIRVSPQYEQSIDPVYDLNKAAGVYSITIQYTLQFS